jgi:hypothetical protein
MLLSLCNSNLNRDSLDVEQQQKYKCCITFATWHPCFFHHHHLMMIKPRAANLDDTLQPKQPLPTTTPRKFVSFRRLTETMRDLLAHPAEIHRDFQLTISLTTSRTGNGGVNLMPICLYITVFVRDLVLS